MPNKVSAIKLFSSLLSFFLLLQMLHPRHKDWHSQPPWLLSLLLLLALSLSLCLACRVSEFSCKGSGNSGNICVPLDKYCDGRSDCADGSDEPKHCSGESHISYI